MRTWKKTFTDTLNTIFDSMLRMRLEELIALDRTNGLSTEERREFWEIRQALEKSKI